MNDVTPWSDDAPTAATDAYADAAAPPVIAPPPPLEAATRLVAPERLNPLLPHEITARLLRRARREMRRAQRELLRLQDLGAQISQRCHYEAQRGQQLARMLPGRRRAVRVQRSLQRARELRAHYDALQAERGRLARRAAAARELDAAWETVHPGRRGAGRYAAEALRRATLLAEREERISRERLDETERSLQHIAAAEDAMRRDSGALRLDPVTFARFAGRRRWSVLLGLAVLLAALAAAFVPPWGLPHLGLRCADVGGAAVTCGQARTGATLWLVNHGDGVLVGWASVAIRTGGATSSAWLPFAILPGHDRRFSCGELSACDLAAGDQVTISVSSSGGGGTMVIAP